MKTFLLQINPIYLSLHKKFAAINSMFYVSPFIANYGYPASSKLISARQYHLKPECQALAVGNTKAGFADGAKIQAAFAQIATKLRITYLRDFPFAMRIDR